MIVIEIMVMMMTAVVTKNLKRKKGMFSEPGEGCEAAPKSSKGHGG